MTFKLKILMLALVATLALTAVAATSASAFTKFKAGGTTTAFHGAQAGTAKFVTNPGTIECSSGTFRGMVAASSEPETIETADSTAAVGETEAGKKGLEWSGCKFLGFIGVAVPNNTCQFLFHAATGKVDIVPKTGECAAKGITYEVIGCMVHVFPIATNQGLSGVTFTNISGSVKVQPSPVSGVSYTAEKCPSGNGSFANGTYSDGSVAGSSSVLLDGTTNTTDNMVGTTIEIV